MMRYGVVGVGYFGADLARFMNEFDDAQITMVYDPENGETIAKELQCVAAKSLEELVTCQRSQLFFHSPDVSAVLSLYSVSLYDSVPHDRCRRNA